MDVDTNGPVAIAESIFNLSIKMGTIDPGKYADLVILNSNPMVAIKNTQDIYMVISKGKIQERKKDKYFFNWKDS